jgi:hypothetical protein
MKDQQIVVRGLLVFFWCKYLWGSFDMLLDIIMPAIWSRDTGSSSGVVKSGETYSY